MDRVIVRPGQVPGDADILSGQRYAMSALGAALQMLIGSGVVVDGLACTPGVGLSVSVSPGAIYSMGAIDAAVYGSLAADAGQIVRQGLSWAPVILNLSAPATPGQSVVWLIEAQLQDQDGGTQLLPFYNSQNPLQPVWQNTNTVRRTVCALQAKNGAAAAVPTAPPSTAGWTSIYTITVANGAASINAGNIALAAGAPWLQTKLPQAAARGEVQANSVAYALDTGTANVYRAAYTPAIVGLVDGMQLDFQAANTNTGAATFAPNGLTAKPLIGGAHAALQGGEIVIGSKCLVMWHAALNSWVLLESTGGSPQVRPATQSAQAVPLAQVQDIAVNAARQEINLTDILHLASM